MVASLILSSLVSYINTFLEERTNYDLQKDIQRKWERTSISSFRKFALGEQIYRRTVDVDNIIHAIAATVPNFIISLAEFLMFFCIALSLEARLTLIYIISLPFLILTQLFHSKYARPVQKDIQEISAKVNDAIGQNISGISTIKVFGLEKYQSSRYLNVLATKIRKVFHKWRIDLKYQSLEWLCSSGWSTLVTFIGWGLVIQNRLSLGSLVALSIYLSRLMNPLENCASIIQSIVLASVSSERILEVLSAPEEEARMDARGQELNLVGLHKNCLVLNDLVFGYLSNVPVLKNVNYTFEPGKIVGISGPNGSGKTTLINLIGRFYEPWKGQLLYEGKDIRCLPIKQYRNIITINNDDNYVFCGTVKENIRLGNRTAKEEAIIEAARIVCLHDFIVSQQNGYDTTIGREIALSKGQNQKLCMARSLIKESRIMIFDEGFSSLDLLSKKSIWEELSKLTRVKKRICILISHDVDTLMYCDELIVLIDGAIAEVGSPRPLLSSKKNYIQYLETKSQSAEVTYP
jgi:ABC-type multidrug transport system fused ATPase/permease subunit